MESSPDVLPLDHTPSGHTHSLTSRARECMSAVCEEVTTCHPHFVLTLSVNNGQEEQVTLLFQGNIWYLPTQIVVE